MAIGDRIRANQAARAAGGTPILDAIRGVVQPQLQAAPRPAQAQPTAPRPVQQAASQAQQTRGDPQVFALQQQLLAAGFNPGPLDGIMGPQTRAAMQAAQAAQAPQPPVPTPNPMRGPPPLPNPRPGPQTPAEAYLAQSLALEQGLAQQQATEPQRAAAVDEAWRQRDAAPSPAVADAWQGPQGNAYASQMQRRGRAALTVNDIPDPATLDLRQMSEFEQAWMGAGRDPAELGPRWQQARYLRQQQMDLEREMVMRQVQQQQDGDRAMYRAENGTNPRIAPPAPPVERSIGEGQYLPNEVVALGQLGASQRNYPAVPALGSLIPASAMPPPAGAPTIGGYYLAPQSQPSLGQLMRRTPSSQPFYGV